MRATANARGKFLLKISKDKLQVAEFLYSIFTTPLHFSLLLLAKVFVPTAWALAFLRRALFPPAHNLPDGLLVGRVEPEPCLRLVDRTTVVRTPYGPLSALACHGFDDFGVTIELLHRYEIAVVDN